MLYDVTFVCGYNIQEWGDDEADLRAFLKRSYSQYVISEIKPFVWG